MLVACTPIIMCVNALMHVLYSDQAFITYPSVVSQYFSTIFIIYEFLCQPVA